VLKIEIPVGIISSVFIALRWLQSGLVRRKLSVCQSNACIVTKRKKDLSQWLKIDLYCRQNIVFHFWSKLNHPAARSLCNSWATC